MMQIKKSLSSFRYAFNGIKYCLKKENNFRVHFLATLSVIIAGFYSKLSKTEWCFVIFAIGLVLITEMVNTAIEKLVDLVSPHHNTKAGMIKDIAAGAVLIAAVVAVVVGIIVFGDKI